MFPFLLASVFAITFAIGVGFNVVREDWPNVIFGSVPALFFTLIATMALKEAIARRRFTQFLLAHEAEIQHRGFVRYKGQILTFDSKVMSFEIVLSLLLVTVRSRSRHFIPEIETGFGAGSVFTIATVLLGWWGLPFGPWWTFQALAANFSGGYVDTIGGVLYDLHEGDTGVKKLES